MIAHLVVTAKTRMRRCIAITNMEMKRFSGILFTMGLVIKAYLEDYWSTDPVIVRLPYYNK